ncbi:MAG: 2-amino-4-hydroxy-6-hydroxymethyldihydropteridine diphosphokinase [Bacteroidales bacterium]|nr:2-amino-4-hydroxy-6-hydroxymethyldihydropteridine diphosphokinase [Bacteroidales bacterium]
MKNDAVLLVGANLDNNLAKYDRLYALLEQHVGEIFKKSAFYQSEPWGFDSQNWFVNQAIWLKTNLSPQQLLGQCQQIEKTMGRPDHPHDHYEDRVMDIDIIFFNQDTVNAPNLQIPHPRMQQRKFVLLPLMEICPTYIHQTLHKTVAELLDICQDTAIVQKVVLQY